MATEETSAADPVKRARDRLRETCERPSERCAIVSFGWNHIGNNVIECPGCKRKAPIVYPYT